MNCQTKARLSLSAVPTLDQAETQSYTRRLIDPSDLVVRDGPSLTATEDEWIARVIKGVMEDGDKKRDRCEGQDPSPRALRKRITFSFDDSSSSELNSNNCLRRDPEQVRRDATQIVERVLSLAQEEVRRRRELQLEEEGEGDIEEEEPRKTRNFPSSGHGFHGNFRPPLGERMAPLLRTLSGGFSRALLRLVVCGEGILQRRHTDL
ncbi:unnamed protein product [Darwinula stevensoni]|uniref:Uncharacterized protein n=1 Tax=Darwinula stevensoni TaxID=69355 RepID=A0A7R9AB28_9CRUS|nr:unnamed protein product [Darwinula stevensoni]CAG0898981.1 unnamed protein product [Darwinula stevensoni]